jgi:hypothetical protein
MDKERLQKEFKRRGKDLSMLDKESETSAAPAEEKQKKVE